MCSEYGSVNSILFNCLRLRALHNVVLFGIFQKLDEMQVKVIVADIDDNGPTFLAHNMTLGTI